MEPAIVIVGGVHKGAGKTTLAGFLLERLAGWGALKVTTTHAGTVCPVEASCTACAELRGPFEVIRDRTVLDEQETDTWRLARRGAARVRWLRATPGHLGDGLREALAELGDLPGIVVEGTSAARHLDGLYLLAARPPVRRVKPSARDTWPRAQLAVLNLAPRWLGGGTELLEREIPIFATRSAWRFHGAEPTSPDNDRLMTEVRRRLDLPGSPA
jgi:hypothetical protein